MDKNKFIIVLDKTGSTSSSFSTIDSVSINCDTNGNYKIRILRVSGSGDAEFGLTITLTEAPGILGFELLFVFYSFALLLGIALSYKYRKSILN